MNRVINRGRGFTLVELIVVLAVIGILATITVVGFSRYQADGRDSRRASSVSAIVEYLEKYYDTNGEYPSCSATTAAATTVSISTLKDIETSTLVAPQAPSGTENSLMCSGTGNILTINGIDFFEYQGDGSETCNTTGSCLKYTIKYKKESDGTIISVDSRRNTSIATSGAITNLTANSLNFSSINLVWQRIENATGYTIERADNIGFTTNVVTIPAATNSATATGLTAGNTYYFRVKPVGAVGSSDWSNIAFATTRALSTPVIAATANSNSQITIAWPDIEFETGYTLQYSTTGSNWSSPTPTTVSGIAANSTSQVVTGLATAVRYYFRLQATAPSETSDWSSNADATTFVPAPASITATANSATQITADWAPVAAASTYTLQYSSTSNFSSGITTLAGLTSTTRVVTGLTQGLTQYFRVYALVGAAQSNASPTASATTSVNTPSSPSITAYRPGAVRSSTAGAWIFGPSSSGNWYYAYATATASCPSGTSAIYQFRANYDSVTGSQPGPSNPAYTSATTTQTWYITQPNSGYKIKFGARAYCNGASANSSWSGYNYSCAANPGSTVACNF
jgi:prepilin-type N-terminal cleavage/methylation domain-containing protein